MKNILKTISLLIGAGIFICAFQIIVPAPIAQIPEDTSEYTAEELAEMRARLEQQKTSIDQQSKTPPVAITPATPIPDKKMVMQKTFKNPSSMTVVQDTENSDFYQTIIKYNLFQPLGWRPHTPPPQYQLLGTSVAANIKNTKAFILERSSKRLHTVRVGDKIGDDALVTEIQNKRVVLLEKGNKVTVLVGGRILFH